MLCCKVVYKVPQVMSLLCMSAGVQKFKNEKKENGWSWKEMSLPDLCGMFSTEATLTAAGTQYTQLIGTCFS